MTTAAAAEAISPDELRQLCAFLYQRTGMLFGESKRYFVERRVSDRIAATNSSDFAAWFSYLWTSPDETERLINLFTVNETYFYREEHQFRCMSESLLPEIIRERRPGDLVRIWSMPCSTGEEAYSIAIWLLENWRLVDAYNIEIVGSEVDTQALAAAVMGLYGERALSRLPTDVADQYFEPGVAGERQIIRDIQESVHFTHANLIDARSVAAQGQFDIIFCRNLLIYFDDISRREAADNLWKALKPDGFLCLGHSESMSRISDRFAVRRFPDAIVYSRS